ncbi:Hypothetical_protein [Hexamita inflata]|uniref:Hypothetical_protein n=1 Tax=Hexamita inflata TaxID=28002 RepID=A0AA86QBS1_9EUKA|nr:Hypothetical protein HINF_LOCUS37764 [Hexamita inflata]
MYLFVKLFIKLRQAQQSYSNKQQNESLNCNLIISTKAQFNHSIFISQFVTIHKSKLSQQYVTSNQSQYHTSSSRIVSEQPPQTTQVSSALELLLTSEVIFETVFETASRDNQKVLNVKQKLKINIIDEKAVIQLSQFGT